MSKFNLVKDVIDEWDPFDLLSIGCPDDEYESEIQRILDVIPFVNNAEELAKKINDILYKALDKDFKKSEESLMVADKILKKFFN